jgi:SPP1 gp7 family putative phage head morphogenesis protein
MPRRRRLPRAAYPHGQERQYAARLAALVDRAWGGGTERIVKAYGRELARRSDELRTDERTIPGPLSIAIEGVSIVFGRLLDKEGELVPIAAGAATAEANAAAVVGQLGAVIAVDPIAAEPWLAPVLEAWRASNTALIRGLGSENSAAVEELVRRAWEEGQTTEWLQRQLQRRLGITGRRAELIARDQIGKLNGQLTMVRQSTYGITHYRWMTSMDERVRQQHADRHGERFAWASPPDDGHPGMPIQCRCVAEPDIEDALAELEREGESALAIGPADIDAVNRAIDELGWWMPDRGLIARLQAEAAVGIRAQTRPRDGAGARARRGPRQSDRQLREPRQPRAPGQRNQAASVSGQPAAQAAAPAVAERPPIEIGSRGKNAPAGMDVVPRGTVILRRDRTRVTEIDGITAEAFEEYKGSGSGFASAYFNAKAERRWHGKHLQQLSQRISGIEKTTAETSTSSAGDADSTPEFASAATILATPRVMRFIIRGMSVEQLERLSVAADVVRQQYPNWTIRVIGESDE